jgi:hypothetical protein
MQNTSANNISVVEALTESRSIRVNQHYKNNRHDNITRTQRDW